MLADHAQSNPCMCGDSDHTIRRGQVHSHWLLQEHVFSSFGAKFNHWKPIIRKRAKVDIIHAWMAAKLFNTPDKLRSMRLGKNHALGGSLVCACRNLKVNIAICRSMFRCNCPCSDDPDSQVFSLVDARAA